ncbi:hypothetical protein GTA08_BOTSDO02154 [Neofusicoccum parvum]|nr:hypothetical protein GTA08_BOTSDO02154 [Neofusicoccum parvum]
MRREIAQMLQEMADAGLESGDIEPHYDDYEMPDSSLIPTHEDLIANGLYGPTDALRHARFGTPAALAAGHLELFNAIHAECRNVVDGFRDVIVDALKKVSAASTPVEHFRFIDNFCARTIQDMLDSEKRIPMVLKSIETDGMGDGVHARRIRKLQQWCPLAVESFRKSRRDIQLINYELDDAVVSCVVDELEASIDELAQDLREVKDGDVQDLVMDGAAGLAGDLAPEDSQDDGMVCVVEAQVGDMAVDEVAQGVEEVRLH